MNHLLKGGCLLGLLLLSVMPINAQQEGDNQLDVKLQMLGHGEMRIGGLDGTGTETTEETDHAYFLLGRTRLTANYKRPGLETRVTAQHSGIWGQKGQGSFNLYEAWAKLSTKNGLFAQMGRIALSYDDERIIGPNDWAMASLSHDVLRLGYEGHGHKAHLILGFNQNAENTYGGTYYSDGAQPYKSLLTFWYHYDVPAFPLGASLLFMNIGMQGGQKDGTKNNAPRNIYQQLLGGYLSYRPGRLSTEASYYRQMGHEEHDAPIDTWMASIKAQLQIIKPLDIVAGYDYLSGDDYISMRVSGTFGIPRHEIIKGFNPVYGSHHKFYGMMDFFYVKTYLDGFTPGLQNLYAGVSCRPLSRLQVDMTYHYMATTTKIRDFDMTLGHAIDFEASYRIVQDARLSVGFSYMTGTETMQRLKLADENGDLKWAWFSIVISPTIFSTRW